MCGLCSNARKKIGRTFQLYTQQHKTACIINAEMFDVKQNPTINYNRCIERNLWYSQVHQAIKTLRHAPNETMTWRKATNTTLMGHAKGIPVCMH